MITDIGALQKTLCSRSRLSFCRLGLKKVVTGLGFVAAVVER